MCERGQVGPPGGARGGCQAEMPGLGGRPVGGAGAWAGVGHCTVTGSPAAR